MFFKVFDFFAAIASLANANKTATTANKDGKQLVAIVLGENSARARDKYMTSLLDKCFKKTSNNATIRVTEKTKVKPKSKIKKNTKAKTINKTKKTKVIKPKAKITSKKKTNINPKSKIKKKTKTKTNKKIKRKS